MRLVLILIFPVVFITGCGEKDPYESYDISFRDFDRDTFWSSCVLEKLKENPLYYNNPLLNKSIDIKCDYESIKRNRDFDKIFKESIEKGKKE